MSHKTLNSRHALESCTYQLHSWKPFQLQTLPRTTPTLDSSDLSAATPKPYSPTSASASTPPAHNKRPCLCDRSSSFSVDALDMSRLSLFDDDRSSVASHRRDKFRWFSRKRRKRGSRSVSGRSSDNRSRRMSVGASGAYATCSDFPVAAGTDSSGELFVNGDPNWSSDVSEAKKDGKEGKKERGGSGEKESLGGSGCPQIGGVDVQIGNESGYGSEPGYRGDAEFGYGDEFDEEEEDGRVMFWGEQFGDTDCNMDIVSDNTFSEQKTHHRCRRKKHDWKMVGMSR